ncbi:MAG: HDOD domain-containing protein [Desulfatiglandaceae bacterium]|jgi:putative nucleotidyltransferase with HDIG domain
MEKRIVPSGSSVIGKKGKLDLEAYLGSCVGVTLVDQEACVGGMLHILLPQPTGTDVVFQPETYATTGIPYFLEAMIEAGASKEGVRACIAGGSLVGPLSEQDLSLDIGGRTAEVVQRHMKEHGIRIDEMETGGYVGRKMSLDLYQLKTAIEPAWPVDETPIPDSKRKTDFNADEAIERVKPIPQVALKVIRMIQEDKYSMQEIGDEIRMDQVISGRVLNLCNSAIMGLRMEIDSIDRAIIVLGEKSLLRIVISASVESLFPQSLNGYSLCKGGLFQHALGTAMVAQELAAFTGKVPMDLAYTAGLLHDIGKIPLDQYVAANAPFFYRIALEGDTGFCEIEKQMLGTDHTEIGRRLAEKWDLPRNLINVISCHHHPEKAFEDENLVALVYLSDLLMSKFQVGQEIERFDTSSLSGILERLGLTLQHLPVLIDRIPKTLFHPASVDS